MNTLSLVDNFGNSYNLSIVKNTYQHNGSMYLGLVDAEEGPYADITVCLERYTPAKDCAFVNVNDFYGFDIIDWLEKHNLGTVTERMGYSGYCAYPEVHFNMNEVNKYLLPSD